MKLYLHVNLHVRNHAYVHVRVNIYASARNYMRQRLPLSTPTIFMRWRNMWRCFVVIIRFLFGDAKNRVFCRPHASWKGFHNVTGRTASATTIPAWCYQLQRVATYSRNRPTVLSCPNCKYRYCHCRNKWLCR